MSLKLYVVPQQNKTRVPLHMIISWVVVAINIVAYEHCLISIKYPQDGLMKMALPEM